MARFIVTADSHIGKNTGLYPGRLAEQEQVWRQTLVIARDLNVDAVLHAGDLFDSRRPTPDVVLAAERPLVDHSADDGCPVLVATGNHDIPSQDGACGLDVLAEAGLIRLSRWPEASHFQGADVVMLPWTPPHRLLSQDETGDRAQVFARAADLLVDAAVEHANVATEPRVLLAHWAVTESLLPSGSAVAGLNEPVLPFERLQAAGFDWMVFGHIHRRQQIGGSDRAFYAGSPQPLDHGDTGSHGVWLLDTDRQECTFMPIESTRFVTIDMSADDPIAYQEYKHAVVRVRIRATEDQARAIDASLVRETLLTGGARVVTGITVDVQREHRDRPAVVADDVTPESALAAWLDHRGVNGQKQAVLARAATYLERAVA